MSGPLELLDYQDLVIGLTARQWLGLLLSVPAAVIAGLVLEAFLVTIGGMFARRTSTRWDDEIVRLLPGPGRLALGLLVFMALIEVVHLPEDRTAPFVRMFVRAGFVVSAVWLAVRALNVAARYLEIRLTRSVTSDLSRRALQTQIAVPRMILNFLLVVIGIALVLWQFPVVQSLGAGVLGVAGLAAAAATLSTQRVLSNIFAGLQIAIAQPVKIGDLVVMEGEQGTIEEITITYVVIRTWDLRRLILPMNYLLEKPIQNLTRGSTKLVGAVTVRVDPAVPVDEVRAAFERILSGSELWNGETKEMVVTDFSTGSVELRALVSADDADRLWSLRCQVREQLLNWVLNRKTQALE